jgi:hypothetical protein
MKTAGSDLLGRRRPAETPPPVTTSVAERRRGRRARAGAAPPHPALVWIFVAYLALDYLRPPALQALKLQMLFVLGFPLLWLFSKQRVWSTNLTLMVAFIATGAVMLPFARNNYEIYHYTRVMSTYLVSSLAAHPQSEDEREQAEQASRFHNLGVRLSELGRREDAFEASREAVDLFRALAQRKPDAFLPDLAGSQCLDRGSRADGRRPGLPQCGGRYLGRNASRTDAGPDGIVRVLQLRGPADRPDLHDHGQLEAVPVHDPDACGQSY